METAPGFASPILRRAFRDFFDSFSRSLPGGWRRRLPCEPPIRALAPAPRALDGVSASVTSATAKVAPPPQTGPCHRRRRSHDSPRHWVCESGARHGVTIEAIHPNDPNDVLTGIVAMSFAQFPWLSR